MAKTKLSESKIWTLLADYYNHMGPKVWEEEIVPSDISSNKYLANIYAKLILANLEDWRANNKHKATEPLYIIEVGAGHGRFGFYILKLLQEYSNMHGEDYFKHFKYIMTDISAKNIALWKKHRALRGFIDTGVLDFAKFNAHSDNEINLMISGKKISKQSLKTPLIAICNYLFDTIPQDAFQVIDGTLYASLISVNYKTKSRGRGKLFENLKYSFHSYKANAAYYSDAALNAVLDYYRSYFTKGAFLIPIGGIGFIKNLEAFTREYCTLLLADKAVVDLEELEGLSDPEISLHGSISLVVNFDAINRFVDNSGGLSLMMPNKHSDFQIACFVNKKINIANLENTYFNLLCDFSPQDLFNLCYTADDNLNPALNSIDTIIALLQLSKWDPGIFVVLNPKLVQIIEDSLASKVIYLQQEKMLIKGLKKVWDYFYTLGTSIDFCFEIGTLYYALEHYTEALEFFHKSIKYTGEQPESLYNLALCCQALEKHEQAIAYCKKALKINIKYKEAKKLLAEYKRAGL